jgi:class 3 adenylate cyclase
LAGARKVGRFPQNIIDAVLPVLYAAPDYARAAWEAAEYLCTPRRAALAAGAAALLLLLRIAGGGRPGWLARTSLYGALFYFIATREEFQLLFSDKSSAWIVAGIGVAALWLPVTLLGGVIRLVRGGGSEGAVAVPAAAASGGAPREAFDVRRNDKEQKQEIVIMMTDIKGYSARMEKDEAATWELLKEHNIIMRKAITTNRGKEIKTIGDAFMVVFQNPLDAVRCGIAMQKGLHEFNKPRAVNDHLLVRIGIHRGEVIVTGKDVFGEGVNIAARLESITDPGGISISADVYQHVKNKIEAGFQSVGTPPMKNIANPPEVFKLQMKHG